jgi:hypothetical protein
MAIRLHEAFLYLAALPVMISCNPTDTLWQLYSPDNQLMVEISMQEKGSGDGLYYAIFRKDNDTYVPIMDPSPLGIEREDTRFTDNLEFISSDEDTGEDSYVLVSGKKLACSSAFNNLNLNFRNQDKKRISLIFRAYNNGIAFRYHFRGKSDNSVRVIHELSGFDFMEGNFWGHPYDMITQWTPAYETYFEGPLDVGTEAPQDRNGWAFPILVESEGSWMLVSEAGFDGSYGGSHLQPQCEDGLYTIRFAEQAEGEGYYENTSNSTLPWHTPWRFIAIGTSLREIVETTLPTDLSAPSRIEDTGWIKPGRASWSWWSISDSPQDYNLLVPFVDMAADLGWEYSLVDANWNRMKNGNVEQLAEYADGKNVGLLLWYNSGGKHNVVTEEPRDLMDERKARRQEFEKISSMGIKGIKVDFFQSDKQEIIRQYIDILEDAADYKLLVNYHGCTLPKGWRRTWPNLVTMESVRGEECYKFDAQFPIRAPHNMAILPFTRNAVGPVDYTPGGFSDHNHPHLTTYGFELAVPVILESGIMHHSDTPERTFSLPSFAVDFLKRIPVAWDDTRYIAGYPGKDVVLARRAGDSWYIGGINGEDITKELTVDLSLTGELPGSIEIIGDGDSARDLQLSGAEVKEGKLTIQMQPYGGFVGYWEK